MSNQNENDTYIIPPNFVDTGTFFGGMFKARNVIEAGILSAAVGIPACVFLPLGLTAKIIVLCLTALPIALFALIGISGESLSSFLVIFLKYLKNRRVVGGEECCQGEAATGQKRAAKTVQKAKPGKQAGKKVPGTKAETRAGQPAGQVKAKKSQKRRREDFPAEFDQVKGYELRQKLRPARKAGVRGVSGQAAEATAGTTGKKSRGTAAGERRSPHPLPLREQQPACLNPVADYLPVSKIENGIIYTKDSRYVKIVEVVPINFLLRSAREQRNIIYSFVSYLKVSPVRLQFKVLTRRADIGRHMDTVQKEMERETNEQCRLMQEDYLQFIQQICSREAVTRRFFLVFEYEPWSNARRTDEEGEAIGSLQSAVHLSLIHI